MSRWIVPSLLALQDNFSVTILTAFFLLKFVTETMIVKMSQMSNFVMITHVCPSSLNVQDAYMKMVQLVRDFVFLWRSGVIGKMIVPMEKMKMNVLLLNALMTILNVLTTNVFQMYGCAMEIMIVVIILTNRRIVRQEIARWINSNVLLADVFH